MHVQIVAPRRYRGTALQRHRVNRQRAIDPIWGKGEERKGDTGRTKRVQNINIETYISCKRDEDKQLFVCIRVHIPWMYRRWWKHKFTGVSIIWQASLLSLSLSLGGAFRAENAVRMKTTPNATSVQTRSLALRRPVHLLTLPIRAHSTGTYFPRFTLAKVTRT